MTEKQLFVKNADGTYNGVKTLSNLSGLSKEEVQWTFNRMKELKLAGKSKEEMKSIVREESKSKPWRKS